MSEDKIFKNSKVQTKIWWELCCNVSSPEITGRGRNMKQNQENHSKRFPQISWQRKKSWTQTTNHVLLDKLFAVKGLKYIGDDLDYREGNSLVHLMKINLIKIKTANVNLIKSSCVCLLKNVNMPRLILDDIAEPTLCPFIHYNLACHFHHVSGDPKYCSSGAELVSI